VEAASGRFAVRRADLDDGVCPAPPEYIAAVGRVRRVTVVLEHRIHGVAPAAEAFSAAIRDDGEGWRWHGIVWPPDVRPGALVSVAWAGGPEEVVLRTAPLAEPVRIDGVAYFHEYDPAVVTHEVEPGTSNRGKVLHTVRRLGRVFEDGSAVFAEADLAARSGLGRGTRGAFLLRNAVEQLIREGYVTRVAGSRNGDGHPSYPPVAAEEPADMLFYAPLIEPTTVPEEEAAEGADGAARRDHWVHGFVRRLPPGAQPSPRQVSLHQRAVDNEQIDDSPLAPGYTFVKKHHRHR
jgi:hypothetical protein